jgi:N-acetylmuramoyl-L-alanine amidase
MKVSLVVGHSKTSVGAKNKQHDTSEFDLNKHLAWSIRERFNYIVEKDMNAHILEIVYREKYSSLPTKINKSGADLCVSMHCNAFNTKASGSEVLYYHKSKIGKELAQIFQKNFSSALGNTDRGVKAKTSEDRGGYLLKETDMPCLVCEPFFLDNDSEFSNMSEKSDELIDAYTQSILSSILLLERERDK